MTSSKPRRASRPPLIGPRHQRRELAWSLAAAFMLGATMVLVWLAFPHAHANDRAIATICAAAYATGLVLLAAGARAPDWAVKVAVAASTVMISGVIYFAGSSDAGLGLFYLWATPYAFFFSARHAVAQIALVAVCLAVALVAQPWIPGSVGDDVSGQEPVRWLLVVVTVAAVGGLVSRLGRSLRDSHERFHEGFDNAAVGMAIISTDLEIVEVNGELARMLGRTREEMATLSVLDITLPEERQATLGYRDAGLSERARRWAVEKHYVHADGSAVPVRVQTSLVRPPDRKPYFFTQVEDIAGRRAHEQELARRARQQEVVARLGHAALRAQSDVWPLLRDVVRAVAATLDVERAVVLALDPDDDTLTVAAQEGDGEALWPDDFDPSALAPARSSPGGMAVTIDGPGRPFGVLAAGADDPRCFTTDDLNFMKAVANIVSTAVARTRAEERTRHAALHDELTGLPNRRLLVDRIGQALRARTRGDGSVAVMMVDLDGFKVINDSLGHAAGDQVLLALAPRLSDVLRPSDSIGRLGGDEFVVVCERVVEPRDAVTVAERLLATIAEPIVLASGPHHLSASAGIAVASSADDTPESLLRDADAAMYRAKQRGRGRYEVFDEPMRRQVIRRLQTENDLRGALDRGELVVHYQPVVRLADHRPIGVEALVRWQHPERGLLGPHEFVPVAEDAGMIDELGMWVLEEACGQAATWQRTVAPELGLSVNVSGRQIARPGFAAAVARVVDAAGLAPGSLMLEITESVLIEEADAPMTVLSELRAHDLRLVLDDFGTGFSSLSYLQRFAVDGLKIDRSFVTALGDARCDGSPIVSALVGMASGLGLHLVVEGVETEAQAARLAELGCAHAQGYLFARPMPGDAVPAYLAASAAPASCASGRSSHRNGADRRPSRQAGTRAR